MLSPIFQTEHVCLLRDLADEIVSLIAPSQWAEFCVDLGTEFSAVCAPHARELYSGSFDPFLDRFMDDTNPSKKSRLRSEVLKRARKKLEQETMDASTGVKHNYALLLKQILDGKCELHACGLTADEAGVLESLFGWTKSFCTAFQGGEDALRKWFSRNGFGTKFTQNEMSCHREDQVQLLDAFSLAEMFESAACDMDENVSHATITECSSRPGMKQVILWSADENQQAPPGLVGLCVALLVRIPAFRHDPPSQPTPGSYLESILQLTKQIGLQYCSAESTGIKIPAIFPTLAGPGRIDPPSAHEVRSMPFVFMAPTIDFTISCSSATMSASPGLKMTGLHGVGKTTALHTLGRVLTVGTTTDLWHIPEARKLSYKTECYSFLQSSTGIRIDNERQVLLSQKLAGVESAASSGYGESSKLASYDLTPLQDWWRGLTQADSTDRLGTHCDVFLQNTCVPPGNTSISLVTADQVNKLLKDLKQTASGAPLFAQKKSLKDFLVWDKVGAPRAALVLAASPDGPREAEDPGTSPHFFELRPPPAAHLAAVLSVAPHYILPGINVNGAMNYRRLVGLCRIFSSNMRQVSYLGDLAAQIVQLRGGAECVQYCSPIAADDLVDAMEQLAPTLRQAYIRLLGKRLSDAIKQETDKSDQKRTQSATRDGLLEGDDSSLEEGSAQSMLTELMLKNASLYVRSVPRLRSSRRLPIGPIATEALLQAVRNLQREAGEKTGSTSRAIHALVNLDVTDGYQFKNQIAMRLFLRHLSSRVLPLQVVYDAFQGQKARRKTDICTPTQNLGRLVQNLPFGPMLWSQDEQGCAKFVQCTNPSEVSHNVLSAARSCSVGETLVIQTANQAPGNDFVALYRTEFKNIVVFAEATVSGLPAHAAKKCAKPPHPSSGAISGAAIIEGLQALSQSSNSHSGAAAAADGRSVPPSLRRSARLKGSKRPRSEENETKTVESTASCSLAGAEGASSNTHFARTVPPAIRNIVSLTATPRYVVRKQPDGSFKFATSRTKSTADLRSIGNAWLEALGADVRFHHQVNDEKHEVTLQSVDGSPNPSWEAYVVCISDCPTHKCFASMKELASSLECKFAFAVVAEHLEICKAPLFSPPSSSASTMTHTHSR